MPRIIGTGGGRNFLGTRLCIHTFRHNWSFATTQRNLINVRFNGLICCVFSSLHFQTANQSGQYTLTLAQRCINVGQASVTLGQQWGSAGRGSRVIILVTLYGKVSTGGSTGGAVSAYPLSAYRGYVQTCFSVPGVRECTLKLVSAYQRVLNWCRFSVGSVSSIVNRRWTGIAFTVLCLVGHVLSTVIPYHSQKTGDAGMVLIRCRASVYGPTLI